MCFNLYYGYKAVLRIPAPKSTDDDILKLFERKLGKKVPPVSFPSPNMAGYRTQNGEITELSLINLELEQIPEEIWSLNHLRRLYLGGNKLVGLSCNIKNLQNLEFLELDNNRISEIPPEICNLSRLNILSMAQNRITTLPQEIRNLHKLTALQMAKNNFTFMPKSIWFLPNLEVLNCEGNQLTALSPEIQKLRKLARFNVGNNRIAELPKEIDKLHVIRSICVKGNPLELCNFTLKALDRLRILDLGVVSIDNHELVKNIARKAKTDCLVRWNQLQDPLNEGELSNASNIGPWRVKPVHKWEDLNASIAEFEGYPPTILLIYSRAIHNLSFGVNGPWSFIEAQTSDGGAVTHPIYDDKNISNTTVEYDVSGIPTPISTPNLIPWKTASIIVQDYFTHGQLSTNIEWEN